MDILHGLFKDPSTKEEHHVAFSWSTDGNSVGFEALPPEEQKALRDALADFHGDLSPAQHAAIGHAMEVAAKGMPPEKQAVARMAAEAFRNENVLSFSTRDVHEGSHPTKAGVSGTVRFNTDALIMPAMGPLLGASNWREVMTAVSTVAWSLPEDARRKFEALVGARRLEKGHLHTWHGIHLMTAAKQVSPWHFQTPEERKAAQREVAAHLAAKDAEERAGLEASLTTLQGTLRGRAREAAAAILKQVRLEAPDGKAPLHFAKAVDGRPPEEPER